ncbi:MAG: DUF1266 domain-containing protein [Propionibacteriaceae bacterium]|jgi:hypothetical protein|nr:DUF1266 domain-containing protein [Propionibacteriaceae bacterium]
MDIDISEFHLDKYWWVFLLGIGIIALVVRILFARMEARRGLGSLRQAGGETLDKNVLKERKRQLLQESKQAPEPDILRGLALGAFMKAGRSADVNKIDAEVSFPEVAAGLARQWDVRGHDEAIETLSRLLSLSSTGEMTAHWNASAKSFDKHTKAEAKKLKKDAAEVVDLSAWDLARAVNVAEWSYLIGYISRDELSSCFNLAVYISREHYANWPDYGLAFLVGRDMAGFDNEEMAYHLSWFLGESRSNETWKIWQRVPF